MKKQNSRAKAHRFMSKVFCSVMIAMAIVSFASCDSKHPSNLVGKWERTGGTGYDQNGHANFFIGPDRIEFLKDGKALYQMYGYFGEVSFKGEYKYRWGDVKNTTWEVSDNRLFIHSNYDEDDTYDYKISGSELELRQTKYGKEQSATYKKTKTFTEKLNYFQK